MFNRKKCLEIPAPGASLPGRSSALPVMSTHYVNGNPLRPPFPDGMEQALFALGCFWGAERIYWQHEGVFSTSVGYAAGTTPNPTYEEVCSGRTGHTEAVFVVFDPHKTSYEALLKLFWESHDPTQGMRQGNDIGTQYRSGIYFYNPVQEAAALKTRALFQETLAGASRGSITTEILQAPTFNYAEDYHQQYLAKNPGGYCGLGGTGLELAM